eukprot:4698756-Pleurochrysis_carterae.AAC.1
MGVQEEAQRRAEGTPVRPRVCADSGRRLRPDLLRYYASDVLASTRLDCGWQQHAHAPLGFRCSLPPGRVAGRGGGLLSRSTRLRHPRRGRPSPYLSSRETSVRYGAGRPSLAAYTLSVATAV